MTHTKGSKTVTFFSRLALIIFIGFFSWSPAFAQEAGDKGGVRISWGEFRKLLDLDKDEFVLSWEEFQIILRQTGFKYVPPYQLKEEKVVLTREQFKRLLNQMKPPVTTDIQPPADYLLTRASYTGQIAEGSARFHVAYDVEIFERQRNQYVKIPFFPVSIALKKALLDGKQALVVLDGNRHTVTTKQWGQHKIDLDFALCLRAILRQDPDIVLIGEIRDKETMEIAMNPSASDIAKEVRRGTGAALRNPHSYERVTVW